MIFKSDDAIVSCVTVYDVKWHVTVNKKHCKATAKKERMRYFTDEVGQQNGQQGGSSDRGQGGTFPAAVLGWFLQLEGASGEGVSG